MKCSILIISLLIAGLVNGQDSNRSISEELLESIKTEIWIPFMESYADLDSDKLKSIHSDEIVRVTLAQNEIQTGQDYLENFGGYIDNVKQKGGGLGIAFVILSTAINEAEDIAYQTGYYRLSSRQKSENDLSIGGYGEFNVMIKKEEGLWKLILDSDKRIQLSHDEFNNQKIIYELK